MKLEWHPLAINDRERIFAYIASDDAHAAIVIDMRIASAVLRLIDYPNSGRPGRIEQTRELVVTGTPYIIPYQLRGERIILLRVIHGAQLWPDTLGH